MNDADELEVVRRIERGSGSHYRVSSRDVRAKDVQLLFADSATGAHSTALVSQGRVGALVNAKPAERRALLEEAAGITGLHSRRHEAELRLRAAEANLERLDDVVAALEAQLKGLKRQARQASRYRNLAGHIRRQEAILLHLEAKRALADRDQARTSLTESEAMFIDAVVIRPVMLVGTAVGVIAFVGSLPFTIPTGKVDEAGEALVVEPAAYTFTRPLGEFD